jgi:hypothetical protein
LGERSVKAKPLRGLGCQVMEIAAHDARRDLPRDLYGLDWIIENWRAARAPCEDFDLMVFSKEWVFTEINLENRFCQFGLSQKPGG